MQPRVGRFERVTIAGGRRIVTGKRHGSGNAAVVGRDCESCIEAGGVAAQQRADAGEQRCERRGAGAGIAVVHDERTRGHVADS